MSSDLASSRIGPIVASVAGGVLLGGFLLLLKPGWGEVAFYFVYYGQPQPPVSFPAEASAYIRFTNSVLGAVLVGWMAMVIGQRTLHPERAMWLSLVVWFVLDTGNSILYGIWGNVALNGATIAAFAAASMVEKRSRKVHSRPS